jgi:hypothetical protein
MPRRLPESEAREIWKRLERRIVPLEAGTEHYYDHGAYPRDFEHRHLVAAQYLPDEALLAAIKEGMQRLGEPALYVLAKECGQGEEDKGLDWEIPLSELTSQTLTEVSQGLECYFYSVADNWAIYFHHGGFAFCAGSTAFIGALKENVPSLDPGIFPGLADRLI